MSNPKVDAFINRETRWQEEFEKLREIIVSCGLNEELKWGQPCYTFGKKNIVLMHGFKDYCALLFHKGALLKDDENILIQQTENVQSARQIRFRHLREIYDLETILKSYVDEAVEVEKAGLKVPMKDTSEYEIPIEFQRVLERSAKLKNAFQNLTPGRQRGYLLHFGGAKQAKTRETRIEKWIPLILEGRGLDD